MILTFPDGEELRLPMGTNLCGIQRKGRRPATVTFNREELLELRRNYSYHHSLERALELGEDGIKRYLEKNKETRQA